MTELNKLLEHIHRFANPRGEGGPTDGQLLSRFIASRDEASFLALVRRHGPMVWRLCQRVLGHVQDAEDAFQATFFVLARKAAAVVKRESVGSFLYGVAYRIAREAKAINDKRRSREKQVEQLPHPEIPPAEPQDWLDRELNLLPEHYRAVIVACDLEGQSRKEAARHLGLSEGTVSSRLARGRRLLAKRLSLTSTVVAAALAEGVASSHMPALLLSSTTKAVLGQAIASSSIEILVKGALKAMFLTKLKVAVGTVMVMVALGTSALTFQASGQPVPAVTEPKRDSKPRSELDVLRRENELLKLNLEIVLEKVRAQEAELRALKAQAKQAREVAFSPDGRVLATAANDGIVRLWDSSTGKPLQTDGKLVAVLQGKKDDKQQLRRAIDVLEKALKELREQLKKEETLPAKK